MKLNAKKKLNPNLWTKPTLLTPNEKYQLNQQEVTTNYLWDLLHQPIVLKPLEAHMDYSKIHETKEKNEKQEQT